MLEFSKVKPKEQKNDYWNSGFGDDFNDIPEAHISEVDATQSVHSNSAINKFQEIADPIVISDDNYSFDEEPVIELKTKAN